MQETFLFQTSSIKFMQKMALAQLADEDQIRFLRNAQIEQEKLKLNSAQGKRLVPIFLDILNDAKDLEYVFILSLFRFQILGNFISVLRCTTRK